MPFICFHIKADSSCPWTPMKKFYHGKVSEVRIVQENRANCLVETTDQNKYRVLISKWPMQQWGKTRGVFQTREQAVKVLESPLSIYDVDGNLLNKISKSS